MSKRILMVIVFVVGVLFLASKLDPTPWERPQTSSIDEDAAHNNHPQEEVTSLSAIARSYTVTKSKIVNVSAQELSHSESAIAEVCKKTQQNVQLLTIPQIVSSIGNGDLEFDPECRGFEPDVVQPIVHQLYETCTASEVQKHSTPCEGLLIFYRSYFFFRDKARFATASLNQNELVQGLFYHLMHQDVDSLEEVTTKLSSDNPNSPLIAKISVLPQVMRAFAGGQNPSSTSLAELQDSVTEARQVNPQDLELQELDIYVSSLRNDPDLKTSLEDLTLKEPENPIGPYYLARLAWERGDRQGTMDYLELARKRAPHDTRFETSLKSSKEKNFGENIFEIRLGIDPTQL